LLLLTAPYHCWTAYNSTNVDGGQRNDASTLKACGTACKDNNQCTGFDWDPTAGEGQRCWLSGSWSGRWNYGSDSDVTHYELNRECLGE